MFYLVKLMKIFYAIGVVGTPTLKKFYKQKEKGHFSPFPALL